MSIEQWWPKLKPATRDWLVSNNGDIIPTDIAGQLTEAGRSTSTHHLSDDEIDLVEAFANDEESEA